MEFLAEKYGLKNSLVDLMLLNPVMLQGKLFHFLQFTGAETEGQTSITGDSLR